MAKNEKSRRSRGAAAAAAHRTNERTKRTLCLPTCCTLLVRLAPTNHEFFFYPLVDEAFLFNSFRFRREQETGGGGGGVGGSQRSGTLLSEAGREKKGKGVRELPWAMGCSEDWAWVSPSLLSSAHVSDCARALSMFLNYYTLHLLG